MAEWLALVSVISYLGLFISVSSSPLPEQIGLKLSRVHLVPLTGRMKMKSSAIQSIYIMNLLSA